ARITSATSSTTASGITATAATTTAAAGAAVCRRIRIGDVPNLNHFFLGIDLGDFAGADELGFISFRLRISFRLLIGFRLGKRGNSNKQESTNDRERLLHKLPCDANVLWMFVK